MVVFLMLGDKLLIAQLRDMHGVAAGLHGIAGVRVQPRHHGALGHAGDIGVSALHLVIYNALEHGLALLVKFQPPALLPEDIGHFHRQGMEHGIHIHIHQVVEILLVPAADGINGFIRVGHGVEEGLQGAFQQLHEWLLHRIFVAAVEDGVLQNVEHAGAVCGDGAESNGKGHVFVRPLEPAQFRAALFMGHFPQNALHFLDFLLANQGKMVLLDDFLYHIDARSCVLIG